MIDRGEPYMMTEKMAAAKPQKYLRVLPWRAKTETKATVENAARTKVTNPRIFPFSFFGAYIIKINT